jgi:hypothetical protein
MEGDEDEDVNGVDADEEQEEEEEGGGEKAAQKAQGKGDSSAVHVCTIRGTAGNGGHRTITKQMLQSVYHLPIHEAAQALNIGITILKKYCRRFQVRAGDV